MVNDLKQIWQRGVTIEGIFQGVNNGEGKPVIVAPWPEHPSDAYFVKEDEWESVPALREKLTSGYWSAIGYRSPRRRDSTLEIVPAEIAANADFGHEHSSISGDGLTYVAVRLVRSTLLEQATVEQHRGRPSLKTEIANAYEELRKSGQIDFSEPQSAVFPKIRAFVAKQKGVLESELRGLGNEAIRKAIQPLFGRGSHHKL